MIDINFASRNFRLNERLRTGLIAGSIVLCIVMVVLLWAAASLRASSAALEAKLKAAEAADAQVRPALEEREQLVKYLTAMSGLMETKKFSWTGLLSSLEAVVPRGVALTHLEFKPREAAVTLTGTAQSPEALRTLVMGLEKSSSFKDPYLKHQSIEKGSISFNVVAIYHEGVAPAVAQGRR